MMEGLIIVAVWLALGAILAAYSYATTKRPPGWPLGFLAVTILWPLAFVPWKRLGCD